MRTPWFLAPIAALLLAHAAPAGADPRQGARPRPVAETAGRLDADLHDRAGARRDGRRRERLRQRIRAMRAWYLTEQLALDDATAGQLFPLLGQFDDRIEELHRRGVQLRRSLRRQMAAAPPDRAALNQLVNDLLSHYEDLYRVQRDRFAAVRKVVTAEQSAKLLLILPQIDDAIRRQIQRAMRGPKDRELRKNRARRRGGQAPGETSPPFADPF